MCVRSVDVAILKSSPAMCGDVPLPADANDNDPGFALAAAITSCTVLYGVLTPVAKTSGPLPIRMTGSNDLTASYGIFGYTLGLIAWELIVPPRIVYPSGLAFAT